MPRHAKPTYRIVDGVEQRLCSNPKCPVGWYATSHYISDGGRARARCRACLAAYQREYWLKHGADGHHFRPTTAASAMADLERAWPEAATKFDDWGSWNYETNEWVPTPFDYDSASPKDWSEYEDGEDTDVRREQAAD